MNTIDVEKIDLLAGKEESGTRLDKFLAKKFPDFSRSYFQKLIRKGKVLVNKENAEISYRLKENDEIALDLILPEAITLSPDEKLLKQIKIVYENEDIIVIDKSAGIVAHPSATHKRGTLVNALLAYCPAIANVGEDKTRPGIVHRLDKDTSGLMVIAKNNDAFMHFKRLFQTQGVEKRYAALVAGEIIPNDGVINLSIARSKTIPAKQVALQSKIDKFKAGARNAITYFKVLKRYKGWTLVEARPKTGRMHQIRVHFRAIGHPIANDKKYAFRRQKFIKKLDRHFLHAAYIKFISPKGDILEFSSPLPDDLKKVLDELN